MIRPLYNIHLKLLAALSALVLWFIVIAVENTVYTFPEELNVEVLNLGKNLSLANDVPKVRLYLRIDKNELKTLTRNDFEVYIDLKGAEAGERRIPIVASSGSAQTKILKVEPSEITLKLSPTTEKNVEVRVNVQGKPLQGYEIEEIKPESDTVKLSGAQNIIEKIDHVMAELLLDGTEKADLNQSVMLTFDAQDNVSANLVQITPEQIVVSARISSQLKQREVAVTAGFSREADRTAWESRINITPSSILVQGNEEALSTLTNIETNALEISTLNRTGSVEVGLKLPEGVTLVNAGEKVVVSLIEEEPEEEQPAQAGTETSNEPTI